MNVALEWIEPCIEETHDWQAVSYMDDGGGNYEWSEVRFFWSPSARRFFWRYESGCSCNYWGADPITAADFESGGRDAALRAVREYGEYLSGADKAAAAIRTFKPTKEN